MSQLKVNSIIPVGGVPTGGGGGIVQTKQTVKTDSFTTTSSSLVDITGFSVAITPTSSSSKILIFVSIGMAANSSANATCFALLRGSTNLVSNTSGGFTDTSNCFTATGGGGTSDNERKTIAPSIMFLDSPNTTSATTYKVQMLASGGSTGFFNQWGENTDQAAVSTITVMEVSA
tara:strand:- start:197 stop:721 length:525 start_codon:yes stop_codon:yes gene_type:complete